MSTETAKITHLVRGEPCAPHNVELGLETLSMVRNGYRLHHDDYMHACELKRAQIFASGYMPRLRSKLKRDGGTQI